MAGLRSLIRIAQRAQAHHRQLHVINPSVPVFPIFDLTGAWRAVPIWRGTTSATQAAPTIAPIHVDLLAVDPGDEGAQASSF